MSTPPIRIPITRPAVGREEADAAAEAIMSGALAQGPRVAEFERRFAELVGVKHAIAVANGTLAEEAIIQGLGIKPGDEVITVGHTFSATAAAILRAGATPRFVDIDPVTWLMDPAAAAAAITPKTKALMPVHLFGLIADMNALGALAAKHNLAMIEDACQAVGATQNGKQAGSFGVGAFSLYATKNITSGEGGMITTNDDTLNEWLRTFRSQGMKVRYLHEMLGTNYRMTDIAAAIGTVQLGKLEQFTAARVAAAARYDALLAGAPIVRQGAPAGNLHVYHQYTVHVGPARDEIVKDLANDGIGTGIYYPIPVSQQPYIKERGLDVALPVTDALAKGCLSLPMFAAITAAEQEEVAASLRRAVERHGGSAWPA